MSQKDNSCYPYDLGTFQRPVNTTSKTAQTWFNRGLVWTYAFNNEEAERCFENAIAEDPHCPMAYWGLAYTLGPNYNKPWDIFDETDLRRTMERAHSAAAAAKLKAKDSPDSIESSLIEALQCRYPQDPALDFSVWNKEYASAMETAYRKFPTDLDVVTLYAEALMNLTPWQMWDIHSGQPAPGARTLEVKDILDRALGQEGKAGAAAYSHPGILHLYIHLMEMSSAPESALPIANHLRGLVPDAGHLQHMPTHLDILCGDYQSAITSNSSAILADEKYLSHQGPVNFYSLYRLHNYHFLIYAAMFAAQSTTALDAAEKMEASLPEETLRIESPPLADWLEGFLSIKLHVLIRFGRWDDIINKTPLPPAHPQDLYCVTTATTHYAKAIAHAVTHNIKDAETHRLHLHSAFARIPASRTLFNNKCTDILSIACRMLDGELEYRKGNFALAFAHLRDAIELDDNLPYDEPWGWMQPTRHVYGALLLEQGHVEDAAEVYRADLGIDGEKSLPRALQHRENVWALSGYYECLLRLERKGTDADGEDERKAVREKLERASEGADVDVWTSCFCRLERGVGKSS